MRLGIFLLSVSLLSFSCQKRNDNSIEFGDYETKSEKTEEDVVTLGKNELTEDNKNLPEIDIFSINIFENIENSVEYYESQTEFSVVDNTPKIRERESPIKKMTVMNDDIIIHFVTFRETTYRYIEVLKKTDKHIFGKYIGLSKDKIIEIFGNENTPWSKDTSLGYMNKRYINERDYVTDIFVYFCFDRYDENKIIKKIICGDYATIEEPDI